MRTTLTDKIKNFVIESARLHFRKEVSAISEVQRYVKLLELHDGKKAEELINRISDEALFASKKVTTEYIINEIKKELNNA